MTYFRKLLRAKANFSYIKWDSRSVKNLKFAYIAMQAMDSTERSLEFMECMIAPMTGITA